MKFNQIIFKYVPSDWAKCSYIYDRTVQRSNYPINELNCVSHSDDLNSYEKLENPYLYGQYLLRIWEYKKMGIPFQEQTLYHLTWTRHIENIKKTNLDHRYISRSKFGKGVSFSSRPWYARTIRRYGVDRYDQLIVAKVLVGKCICGYTGQRLPAKGFDTTTGRGVVSVKYFNNEFYPFALFKVPSALL